MASGPAPVLEGAVRASSRRARRLRRAVRALTFLLGGAGAALAPAPARAEGAAEAVAVPSKLSLDDALRTFREHGFDLVLADAAVRGAEGDLRAAAAVPNPALTAGISRAFHYNPAGTGAAPCVGCSNLGFSVGISDQAAILDGLSGKIALRQSAARAALAATKMTRADAERTLAFQVKQQYVQVLAARASVNFAREVQGFLGQTVELNRLRYPRVIDEGQLARVEAEKLEADQAVDMAEQNYRLAQIGLMYLIGVRGQMPTFDVDPELLKYRVPPRLANASAEGLIKSAFDHRPDLKAVGYAEEHAALALRLARRQRFPDVALSLQYSQMGTGQNALQPPTVTFGITAPLPLLYQQQGEIRRAEADRDAQAIQRTKLAASVVADVESALAAFNASRKLVERMETTFLERARRARDITAVQFNAGSATLMDFLDAERNFVQTNVEYFQDLESYWNAVFQIEQAVGTDYRQ